MLNPLSPLPLKDPTLFRQANYLDGKWVEADGGKTIVVKNPATFEAIGEVPAMGAAETRRAIEAANRAYPAWRGMLAKERRAILRKMSDLMLANADDLGGDHDRRAGQAAVGEPRARSSTPPASSSGSPRRRCASTATPSRRTPRAAASWC